MTRLPSLIATLVVVVVAAATAVGVVVANRDDTPAREAPAMMTPGSSSAPEWWGDSWRSMTGPAAVASEPEYLAEMVAHHQEAVVAARELARSNRSQMRAFGESIVQTQTVQIGQMKSWLADWYPEQSITVDYRPMMRDLSVLSGDRLDRAFLQDMIDHHMVAVMMSQHLLWQGTDHEDVAQLARAIRDDQHAEIIQMQQRLAQWFNTDWRPGMGAWSGQALDRGMGPGMMDGSKR